MERTLKSVAIKPRQGQSIFLFPGESEIEPWELRFAEGAEKSQCAKICKTPRENPWQKRSTLVLPVTQVFCLPLWLNETETDRLPGMLELQLESRGTAARGDTSTVYQWQVVAQVGNRTLVLVGMLPATLPASLEVKNYHSFDVSARYLAWPEDSLTLWQEQGKLAVAFTRGKNLVYFQPLGEESCSARTLQALTCLRASLEIQHAVENLSEVVVFAEINPEEMAALGASLQLPVRKMAAPSPAPPAEAWNLCPPEVMRSKQEQQTQRWRGRALGIAFLAYLLLAAFLLIQFLVTSSKISALKKWQADHATDLAAISTAQDDWKQVGPVVDTTNYPLEILLRCANAIPKNQLRMTLFELNDGTVQIRAEANNVASAYVFFDQLKAEPHLSSYTWKMDEPHLLANDLAQLQIEGTHAAANP